MGLIAETVKALRNQAPPISIQSGQWAASPSYPQFSRAYMNNEIVFASIEMLASSAGEPNIIGRRWQRSSPQIRNEEARLRGTGLPLRNVHARMIDNGFYRDMPDHPLVKLLNNPNPFMSRGQLWGTVVMDRALAGNAFLVKSRAQAGPLKGSVRELWRLRPDRVKVIPSVTNFIEGYEYNTGRDRITFAPTDILHFKTRHPLNDYYGMPPLMACTSRLDIDEYMRGFLRSFFERGGTGPGSVLTVKQKLSQEAKDEIRNRFRGQFGGGNGWHEMLVLDAAESTYTQMGLNRGLRDALPKELDAVTEARIAMIFGIPGSILGLLIGYESSSYANKRQDWQVFWDLTMAPLLSDLDDVLNLNLLPDFGGIDEVMFDLSDIRALQEDVDAIQERHRKNFAAGISTLDEAREAIGYDPAVSDGIVYVPSTATPTEIKLIGEQPEPIPAPAQLPGPVDIVAEVHCPKCNRWVGRNMNVGATAYCPKDKEVLVTLETEQRTITVVTVVRDEEGRVSQLVGGGE